MINYFIHRNHKTERVEAIDPAWLDPESGVVIWADVSRPTDDDGKVLLDVFGVHPLAVQDALQPLQRPKVETYDGMLYVVLHGINFKAESDEFDTHDTDFFVTRSYLITVHDGQRRSIGEVYGLCGKNHFILAEGPVALMHRIVDTMVDHYRPEVDEVEAELDSIESRVLEEPEQELTRGILAIKRDIAHMRRIILPQRDVVARLARREFDLINQEMSYRFRDVFDSLVRLSDDALIFQERVTGILEAHLATISNRLSLSAQRLAAVATIFGILTVITGAYGMNVALPGFPGPASADFWWLVVVMGAITAVLVVYFRRKGWL